jgi:mannose-6-phosphate isomerase-like protein (cupin superfamily)
MAEYTLRNLEDVEDAAPKFGLDAVLEAHFAREELELERSGMSLQRLAPNARLPFGHHHRAQEELYVVVEGSGRVALGDEIVPVRRWDAVRVPPETTRSFEAGPDGMAVLAFGAPFEGANDVEMEPGWWPDEAPAPAA